MSSGQPAMIVSAEYAVVDYLGLQVGSPLFSQD